MSYLLDELKKIEHFIGDEFSKFETHLAGLFNHFRGKENNKNIISDLIEAEIFFKDALASAKTQNNVAVIRFINIVANELASLLELNVGVIKSIGKEANEYLNPQQQTS